MNASIIKNWLASAFVVAIIAVAITLLISFVAQARHQLVLKQTHNDLRWIGMALHRYHDEHGHFPPAVVRGEDSVPRHSWRSLIQHDLGAIVDTADEFSAYDLDEPWNSIANNDAAAYHRFGNHDYQFLAVVGPNAAWASKGTRQLSDFTDGTRQTILVVAIRDSGIAWHEPRDAVFNGTTLMVGQQQLQLSHHVFVLTANGTVRYCAKGIPHQLLTPLITVDAGDNVPEW